LEPCTSKHFEDEEDEIVTVRVWAVTYAMPIMMKERRELWNIFIVRAVEQCCALTVETWKGELNNELF
jgi:hypothetical protein